MNILITGVAGFIGSNLAEELIRNNHTIVGIDNFEPTYPKEIKQQNLETLLLSPRFSFIEADIRNFEILDPVFKKEPIGVVIHLAALSGVRNSIEHPAGYVETNVNGTLNLLEAMKKNAVRKMIFASSSSVYGNNKKLPFSEADNVDFPISPYAASKKAAELICRTYAHLYDFDISCLRFFTVYGPRQRPDLAIYKFTRALFEANPISLYGNGTTARDYTYIDDIVQGTIRAIEQLKGFEIYNLGGSDPLSLLKLIELLQSSTGKKADINNMPMQAGDVEITYADISKAKEKLNYDPKTNIGQGLEKFVKWYGEHQLTITGGAG